MIGIAAILTINNIKSLSLFISKITNIFDKEINCNEFINDVKLLQKGIISMVRITGKIQNIKVSINTTTLRRLQNLYEYGCISQRINKIAHTDTNLIILAHNCQGNEILTALWPVYIKSQTKQRMMFVPDFTWISDSKNLFAGLFTDFIAKGEIIKDTKNKRLKGIQESILNTYKAHASKEIRNKEIWHKMFASNDFFSPTFKENLKTRMRGLEKSRITKKCSCYKSSNTKKNDNVNIISIYAAQNKTDIVSYKPTKGSINISKFLYNTDVNDKNKMLHLFNNCIHVLSETNIVNNETLDLIINGNLFHQPANESLEEYVKWGIVNLYIDFCLISLGERNISQIKNSEKNDIEFEKLIKLRIKLLSQYGSI